MIIAAMKCLNGVFLSIEEWPPEPTCLHPPSQRYIPVPTGVKINSGVEQPLLHDTLMKILGWPMSNANRIAHGRALMLSHEQHEVIPPSLGRYCDKNEPSIHFAVTKAPYHLHVPFPGFSRTIAP
jgi:hypothetical protein